MSCTKAQILLLVSYIRQEIYRSKTIEEARERIDKIYSELEARGFAELISELGLI